MNIVFYITLFEFACDRAAMGDVSRWSSEEHVCGEAEDLCCVSGYLSDQRYLGATVGRVANRIARGHFVVEGKEYRLDINNGPNALHGGLRGFNKVRQEVDEHPCRQGIS